MRAFSRHASAPHAHVGSRVVEFVTKHAKLWLMVLGTLLMNEPVSACNEPTVGYLVGSNNYDWLTPDERSRMAKCAAIIVLDVPAGNDESLLTSTIARFHDIRPGLPVLAYTWLTRWVDTPRAGSRVLEPVVGHTEWLTREKNNKPIIRGIKPNYFPDLGKPAFRQWAVEQIASWVDRIGADGVFLDMLFAKPVGPLAHWCKSNPKPCQDYIDGVTSALVALKARLPGKLLIGNGIFRNTIVDFKKQEELLEFLDGMAIEYFGMVPKTAASTFESDILAYLQLIDAHPKNIFMIFGRAPWAGMSRDIDERWAKYLYAAYMLVARDGVSFKYHASFQVPRHAGDSGGVYLTKEQRDSVALGRAVARYETSDGLYWRRFVNGLIALCPHDRGRPCPLRSVIGGVIVDEIAAQTPEKLSAGDTYIGVFH